MQQPRSRRALLLTLLSALSSWVLATLLVMPANAQEEQMLLPEVVARSPETAAVARALEERRQQAMASLLREVQARLAKAKADGSNPQEILALAELEEQYTLYFRASMLPDFLREPPAVFTVKTRKRDSLRFVAFGDYGEFGQSQETVAKAVRGEHRKHRFDMGITLGDNFYNEGAVSLYAERWKTQWEDMYSPLGIEFYAALGNHDWGHTDSPAAETIYSFRSKSWRMPAIYYSYTAGPVQFFVLDTGTGEYGEVGEKQLIWLKGALAASSARWRIVYAHHPLFGAAREDSLEFRDRMVPVLKAGGVDAYIAGHDHVLAHFKPEEGIESFIAGGGGSSSYDLRENNARLLFGKSAHGFLAVNVARDGMQFRFIDENGSELYRYELAKDGTGQAHPR